jgi:multiple sugar transport system ATP-binding protein
VGEAVHLEVEPTGWRLFDGAGEALQPPPLPEPEANRREPLLPRLG